jgi:uncharacterized protein YutE (UPF0331/DUF86 family)/predicted nucleotidyltransferase
MPSKLQLLPRDIARRLQELPGRVAACDGLVAFWLFGSFAQGQATPISDVDLAYLPAATLQDHALDRFETSLYHTIADALQTDDFTFANMRRLPAHFAWQVLASGRLLLCRDTRAVAIVAETVYRDAPDVRWLRHTGNTVFLEITGMSERDVDQDRIIDFLRLISANLRDLHEKARTPKEVYIQTRDMQAVVERRLQTAIESCLNIGNHMIARLGLRAPQDYAEVFRILGEEQILPPELATQMMDMARLRNLLVHIYWETDQARLFDSLPARLATIEGFVERLAQWILKER